VLTSLCMYRVKAGSEAAFRQLLSKHWPTLRNVGLAADEPPVTYEGIEKPGAAVCGIADMEGRGRTEHRARAPRGHGGVGADGQIV
jgi:hypothetical protein